MDRQGSRQDESEGCEGEEDYGEDWVLCPVKRWPPPLDGARCPMSEGGAEIVIPIAAPSHLHCASHLICASHLRFASHLRCIKCHADQTVAQRQVEARRLPFD